MESEKEPQDKTKQSSFPKRDRRIVNLIQRRSGEILKYVLRGNSGISNRAVRNEKLTCVPVGGVMKLSKWGGVNSSGGIGPK